MVFAGCASQRDMSAVDNRLTEMELRTAEERKNRDQIKSQVDEYAQMRASMDEELRRQSASLHALVEELREEIRLLNGKLEEIEFSLGRQQKTTNSVQRKSEDASNRLTEATGKNDDRITRIEQYLNFESAGKPGKTVPAPTPVAPVQPKKEPTEDEIYKSAKQAFDQGDSETAKKRFQEVIARFGRVIFLSDAKGIERLGKMAAATVELPEVHPFVAPILYTIPVQLLAYHVAVIKGTDVDQPRNLAKSVTVE